MLAINRIDTKTAPWRSMRQWEMQPR